jgi:hypothetical protein
MVLRIENLASATDIEASLWEWETLAARTSPWSPFATPTWNTLRWKHYCNRQMLGSRWFFVHVIRGECNRLIGVAPLLLRRIPVIGGLELCAIEFFGTDPSITEIRGVVASSPIIPSSAQSFPRRRCRLDGVNREFIREFVGAMALRGRLRIFELEIAGEEPSRCARGSGDSMYTRRAYATREAPGAARVRISGYPSSAAASPRSNGADVEL